MSYWPEEGGAWGCQVNAHRHQWNGSICANPCNWDCGAKADFRENYCELNDPSCYQLYMFHPVEPWFTVDEKGLQWLIDADRNALDGQVLFTFCHEHREPGGALHNNRFVVAGIYVVDRVEEDRSLSHKTNYRIVPKAGAAVMLVDLKVRPQKHENFGRPYLRHYDGAAVHRMVQQLITAAERQQGIRNEPRIKFLQGLRTRLDVAARLNLARRQQEGRVFVSDGAGFDSPFKALENVKLARRAEPATKRPGKKKAIDPSHEASTPEPPPPAPRRDESEAAPTVEVTVGSLPLEPLFEMATVGRLTLQVGQDVARSLWLAGRRPNSMILLRGAPGIGKSRLALESTNDMQRLVVAVSATWRGREDLLGFASPVSGRFQPTGFTEFLRTAERAWHGGDRSPWVVLFEEFNLSPPEYWLSDILVRSQYAADAIDGRLINLGGAAPEEWAGTDGPAVVWLSPAIRFIGTINSDHTTRDLSPRVLDRVSLIELELLPEAMFERLSLALDEPQRQAIKELHQRLERRGAAFSMRTALSIQPGLEDLAALDATDWDIIDLVLVTQMLSKVRLFVGEPGDHQLVVDLAESWAEEWGAKLPRCLTRFERWRELLDAGFDVVQA